MRAEFEDRILEACLDEVLGGHYPPDLTAKILQTLEKRQTAEPVAPPVQSVVLATPANSAVANAALPSSPQVRLGSPRPRSISLASLHRKQQARSRWWTVAAGSGVLVAGLTLAILLVGVERPEVLRQFLRTGVETQQVRNSAESEQPQSAERQSATARFDRSPDTGATRPGVAAGNRVANSGKQPTAIELNSPFDQSRDNPGLADGNRRRETRVASSDDTVIEFVNDAIRLAWRDNGVEPAPAATDVAWCERVYQKLIGRSPSSDEIQAFTADERSDRRAQLVDSLLADDEHARQWAANWAGVLIGRSQGADLSAASAGSIPANAFNTDSGRADLTEFLRQAIQAEMSHAEIATALLTAQGSNSPVAEDFNGAVNFLVAGASDHGMGATAATARVFLGKQLQCVQCHDQPASGRHQSDFWGLNAFFRQMKVHPAAAGEGLRLADEDFHGDSGAGADAEIFYAQADGRMKMVYPRFGGIEQPHSGLVSDFDRRRRLSELVVASNDFPRATVNRVWAWIFGYGFTAPVDDMGPHNPESHPTLLSRLSDEFSAHDFDTRSLARWLVLSDAFGLAAEPAKDSRQDSPELGGRPLFARSYERRLDLPEAQRALLLAANSRPPSLIYVSGVQANRGFAVSGQVPGRIAESTSAPQPTVNLPPLENGWLHVLAESTMSPPQKIEHLFSAALGRRPTERETTAAKLVLANQLDRREAVFEIWRALLNCREMNDD